MSQPITVTEAAAATGLSRAVITKWCRAGIISGAFKLGRLWVLPHDWQRPQTRAGRPAKQEAGK